MTVKCFWLNDWLHFAGEKLFNIYTNSEWAISKIPRKKIIKSESLNKNNIFFSQQFLLQVISISKSLYFINQNGRQKGEVAIFQFYHFRIICLAITMRLSCSVCCALLPSALCFTILELVLKSLGGETTSLLFFSLTIQPG